MSILVSNTVSTDIWNILLQTQLTHNSTKKLGVTQKWLYNNNNNNMDNNNNSNNNNNNNINKSNVSSITDLILTKL